MSSMSAPIAIYDLLEDNSFAARPSARPLSGCTFAVRDNRLVFDIRDENDAPLVPHRCR